RARSPLIPYTTLFRSLEQGTKFEKDWEQTLQIYSRNHPEKSSEFLRVISGKLPENWKDALPVFPSDEKGMATRSVSGKVINALRSEEHTSELQSRENL